MNDGGRWREREEEKVALVEEYSYNEAGERLRTNLQRLRDLVNQLVRVMAKLRARNQNRQKAPEQTFGCSIHMTILFRFTLPRRVLSF
ncbi:hypothetical protein BgiBS90_033895 [Biomphalaria glabrata]|nr:hypothetical protein BgiBS90_033895 [Biomphalaria glabrata]